MWRLLFFAFAILCFSCSVTEERSENLKINFSNPKLLEIEIQDWVRVEKMYQLELPDSIYFGKVKQIEFSDYKIYLLVEGVNPTLFIFDRNGNFLSELNRKGTGPGEYNQIEFFINYSDMTLIYDRSQIKFISYSNNDFSDFQEFKMGDYFLGGFGHLDNDQVFLISDSDDENGKLKGYGFFSSDFSNITYKPQMSGYIEAFLQQSISQFNSNAYLVQPFSEQIFKIENDSLIPAFQIDFGAKKIPSEVADFIEAEEFYELLARGSYYFATTNLLVRENSTAFNFYNETIENLNMGLIQDGKAFRFPIESDLEEIFLKPISVREDLFHTILLPGEFDEEVAGILSKTDIDYEKPILVSYTISQ